MLLAFLNYPVATPFSVWIPKYINSKQTKLYNKGKILYGYNKAKRYIAQSGSVYITEGYFDVMALHTVGIKNSVALCGTALTKEHLALLSKYDNIHIYLALDNDVAGRSATLRAISLLIQYEFYDSYVVEIKTSEKDFNDMLLRDRGIFAELMADKSKRVAKIPIIQYCLRDIYARLQAGGSIENKARIVREVAKLLNSIKDRYVRIEYNKYADRLFGFHITNVDMHHDSELGYNAVTPYNLTMARVLKEAYNNREYKEILKTNTSRDVFLSLEECYDNCINDTLNPMLAHIVFNDEYVMRYCSVQDFIADVHEIVVHAKRRNKARFLRSGASMSDKVRYCE